MFMIVWMFGLLYKNRYDFVHAHEEAIFFCRFLKPLFRFKLIYDMHSSLPQQLTNFQFTKSKFMINLFKSLEDSCLRSADVIITICPDLADYVNGLIQDNKKHLLIENSIFEPVRLKNKASDETQGSSCTTIKDFKLPNNKKLIVYAGTLEPYQGVDILIQAFSKVLGNVSDSFLVIVGGSAEQVIQYSRLAESLGLNGHFRFTGRVPQGIAKKICEAAAVQTSPRSGGTNTPLKVYEQLASGIPLVATRIYSHTQILKDDVAFLVEPNPDDMAAGIIRALSPEGEGNRIATNAKKLYEEKYSRPMYEEKIRRALKLLSE
jgi:glycosyltransferase involved in cell wall biosynthesis